jgi:hypothetical protein
MGGLARQVQDLSQEFVKVSQSSDNFNDRFANYQQANQWVAQLAFALIGGATFTVIVASIVRR